MNNIKKYKWKINEFKKEKKQKNDNNKEYNNNIIKDLKVQLIIVITYQLLLIPKLLKLNVKKIKGWNKLWEIEFPHKIQEIVKKFM